VVGAAAAVAAVVVNRGLAAVGRLSAPEALARNCARERQISGALAHQRSFSVVSAAVCWFQRGCSGSMLASAWFQPGFSVASTCSTAIARRST
jgi:hypothetical protein